MDSPSPSATESTPVRARPRDLRPAEPSLALLRALAMEVPGRFEHRVDGPLYGGDVTITRGALEWTGMGSEWESEVVFRGPRELAFRVLCELVNAEKGR